MKEFRDTGQAALGSFIVDEKGTVLGFDQSLEELTGWPAVDIVGRHKELGSATPRLRGDVSLETIPLYDGTIPVEPRPAGFDLTLYCRDGRRLDVEAFRQPLNGPGERMLTQILRVVASSSPDGDTPHRGRDTLTGLLDNSAFYDQLSTRFINASAAARPISVILIDIDHLRKFNDREGRQVGDDALHTLAAILRASAGDDAVVGRLGDDDFAILLDGGTRSEARQVAASIRSQVERHDFTGKRRATDGPQLTVTLGAASFPADADSEAELLERAADALSEARLMGRNRVWCYLRRPRVPVQVPVYFDGTDSALLGYMRDLSPSGIFLQTTAGIDVGMRCALTFPLPGHDGRVHVVGRVVRTVSPELEDQLCGVRIPGIGVEFERFGDAGDRRAIDSFLHGREQTSLRPESGILSVDS
jgi:diguanylate cyclase (GGDEF)-like protein